MNAAARKAYERHARLNRWAAWAGMALVGTVLSVFALMTFATAWATISLLFTL